MIIDLPSKISNELNAHAQVHAMPEIGIGGKQREQDSANPKYHINILAENGSRLLIKTIANVTAKRGEAKAPRREAAGQFSGRGFLYGTPAQGEQPR